MHHLYTILSMISWSMLRNKIKEHPQNFPAFIAHPFYLILTCENLCFSAEWVDDQISRELI